MDINVVGASFFCAEQHTRKGTKIWKIDPPESNAHFCVPQEIEPEPALLHPKNDSNSGHQRARAKGQVVKNTNIWRRGGKGIENKGCPSPERQFTDQYGTPAPQHNQRGRPTQRWKICLSSCKGEFRSLWREGGATLRILIPMGQTGASPFRHRCAIYFADSRLLTSYGRNAVCGSLLPCTG